MVWTRYSISIAFNETVFDESDGSVKSDNHFLFRLADANI